MKIEKELSKDEIFSTVEKSLLAEGFRLVGKDDSRPWGGFFVIDENQISAFRKRYFPEVELTADQLKNKLSPKILLVGPEKRLSWQYHHRRAEIWKLIAGDGGIVRSDSDTEGPLQPMETGKVVRLKQGERHRLVGLKNWGLVAEIWMHTDPANPSDESDIVRVQDDFQRR
ncbi:Mannose-6-phosphate isomerase, cupin superfamily [Cyclobacterium lianum]|uniref:Mannose-6-phosphate isomerase, cupin superfamily n=1 Tax=Cyclobacterium lianum TaxID=388280 RepID=A0A1M7PW61_9BACT|nr:phosphoheptose isomerase [Cyclobacterium lianum]SHN21811.1 Mannose-6-phosphate isomerase, cupin superfamily [Cyclobacterium lianum]